LCRRSVLWWFYAAWSRVLSLASEYVSKQVRVVPSINRPTRVNILTPKKRTLAWSLCRAIGYRTLDEGKDGG
jgi:hypothetical protein